MRCKDKGFTLVELVLVIAMLGILGMVLGPGLATALKGYEMARVHRQVVAEARSAMERFVREARLIQSSLDVLTLGASSFQFEYPNNTILIYDLNSGNLRRNSDVLASNVSALTFIYYDEVGIVTATPANVRRVQIRFTITPLGNQGSYTLQTNVFLRNTGNNYTNFVIQ